MILRRWVSHLAGFFACLPLIAGMESMALANSGTDAGARGGDWGHLSILPGGEALAPPAPSSPLSPPSFGSEGSVRLAMALHRGEKQALPLPLPTSSLADEDKDKAEKDALTYAIVYGSVSAGCFVTAGIFIPVGAVYFFTAVSAQANGQNPGFQPTMPLFFIGLGLLVPGFIFLSRGLDKLRLYRSLTASWTPSLDRELNRETIFAGLPPLPRDLHPSGGVVILAF